jgi:hypothetical protein
MRRTAIQVSAFLLVLTSFFGELATAYRIVLVADSIAPEKQGITLFDNTSVNGVTFLYGLPAGGEWRMQPGAHIGNLRYIQRARSMGYVGGEHVDEQPARESVFR